MRNVRLYRINENISNLTGRALYNSVDDNLSSMELDAYVSRFYSDDENLVISVGRYTDKKDVEDVVFPYGYAYYDAGASDDRTMITFKKVNTIGESLDDAEREDEEIMREILFDFKDQLESANSYIKRIQTLLNKKQLSPDEISDAFDAVEKFNDSIYKAVFEQRYRNRI